MLWKKIVINDLVAQVAEELLSRNQTVATAESCTGGLIGASFTSLSGSSQWYIGGFITYTNEMKEKCLGVGHSTFEKHGAVSEQCARQMVEGARVTTQSDYAISVTGIAGPGGGSEDKPVGLVYIGVSKAGKTVVTKNIFDGDRESVRHQTREKALELLLDLMVN